MTLFPATAAGHAETRIALDPRILLELIEIKHHKAESGWVLARARAVADSETARELDFRGELILVGIWADAVEGIPFLVHAVIEVDAAHGRQIVLMRDAPAPERVERLASLAGWARYLTSIKRRLDARAENEGSKKLGIGEGKLSALLRAFGTNAVTIARIEPERVAAEVKGWTTEQAEAFSAELAANLADEQARIELAEIGAGALSARQMEALLTKFRAEAPAVLRRDPYALISEDEEGWELAGYGWRKADLIALRNLHWAPSLPSRVGAGIMEALGAAARDDGSCYLTTAETISKASALLSMHPAMVARVLLMFPAVLEDRLDGRESRIYLESVRRAEERVAQLGQRASEQRRRAPTAHPDDARITAGLNAEQRAAYYAAMSGGVVVLTGGPGRGKTHTCRAIIEGLRARKRIVMLLAPTGRAAARAAELTGHPASTVHRALASQLVVPRAATAEEPQRERPAPPAPTDIILDEQSMMDVALMARLLRRLDAMGAAPNLLLVGDADQLPPVGPGKPFCELIDSGLVPVTRLVDVMRTDRLGLIEAAAAVNSGAPGCHRELQVIADRDPESFRFCQHNDAAKAREAAIERVRGMIASGVPRDDIQTITATNEDRRALNVALEAVMNPSGERLDVAGLRAGDRVMQLKNERLKLAADPQKTALIANGEIGRALRVERADDGKPRALIVDFGRDGLGQARVCALAVFRPRGGFEEDDAVEVSGDGPARDAFAVASLTVCWAATCHKFQGSEAAHVVLVFGRSSGRIIDRSWIYTAITRARLSCTVIAPATILDKAVTDEPAIARRRTGLVDLLADIASKRQEVP